MRLEQDNKADEACGVIHMAELADISISMRSHDLNDSLQFKIDSPHGSVSMDLLPFATVLIHELPAPSGALTLNSLSARTAA